MTKRNFFLASISAVVLFACAMSARAADKPVHLFILSGQSNMAGLNPAISFTPTVTEGLPDGEVIVAKSAQGGQPIRRWYKEWKSADGVKPEKTGDLYDRLMTVVKKAVGDKKPTTITFVWMQGERDAKESHGDVYAASMKGLIEQLRTDLDHKDMSFVIGRLSDCLKTPHWEKVREAQVEVAKADPLGEWVDTDDLNGEKDGLHYNKEGYKELGKRFADKALEQVKAKK